MAMALELAVAGRAAASTKVANAAATKVANAAAATTAMAMVMIFRGGVAALFVCGCLCSSASGVNGGRPQFN